MSDRNLRGCTASPALASLGVGIFILLNTAVASAQDHTQVALDFVNTAIVNDWSDEPNPCWINWTTSPPSGATRGACFFTLSLMRARGYQDRDLQSMWGAAHPDSDRYFDLIDASPALNEPAPTPETYFRRIMKATDIRRGDILAIAETDTLAGHTVIVTGPAVALTSPLMPIYTGTKQYAVPIVDSTEIGHVCNASYPDSRWRGPCSGGYMDPGAGTAYMRVYTDATTGNLLGFTWSVSSSLWSYFSPATRPYRVGRLYRLPAPMTGP